VFEHLFAGDDVGVGRTRNKLPSLVPLQSIELLLHGRMPLWISKRCSSGGGNRRERTLLEKSLPVAHLIWLPVAHMPCAAGSTLLVKKYP
jgi:hypothetical protein